MALFDLQYSRFFQRHHGIQKVKLYFPRKYELLIVKGSKCQNLREYAYV